MSNIGKRPVSLIPVPSDHGDVHELCITRSNGDSITVDEYRRAFAAITGRELTEDEVDHDRPLFAEADRG